MIDRQTSEIRRLSESATMWQIRAMQAEEKLKMLTAGDVPDDQPSTRAEPPTASPAGQGEAEAEKTTLGIEAVVATIVWRHWVNPRSRWWTRALPILAAHGLVPGPDGFDVTDLATLAQQRGWQVSTEHTGHHGRGRRWRATIFTRYTPAAGSSVALSGNPGHGSTEDEALAIALAGMIRQSAQLL